MIDDPLLPPVGVFDAGDGRLTWCVWAPLAGRVDLVLDPEGVARRIPMESAERGHHTATAEATWGVRYAFSLEGKPALPDPRSRLQPGGVRGPSGAFDPARWSWDEGDWRGIERRDLVFYELHVGTFTPEGTFDAVIPRLDALRELGVTAIELMPVSQFPGTHSWGYDGVFPFAVQDSYGGPEGLKRLIEACHKAGLAVVLDLILNHLGPDGNVFPEYGPYFTDRYKTDWGSAINFDGAGSDSVRSLVLDLVRMWVRDYRFDGLRLDAADQIYDKGPAHILAEVAEMAHLEADRRGRPCHVFAETDLNDAPRFVHGRDRGGYGLDGHWNDDFHHAAHFALVGEKDGYYADFAEMGPAGLAKVFERVFVNDGAYSPFRGRRHGTCATEFSGDRFVAFTQNHDQVGNRMKSDRYAAGASMAVARLAAGILLLSPRLPLLFMGEEYGETNPFPFFCSFEAPDLIEAVREGRRKEFASFGWQDPPPDPVSAETRATAVLSWAWDGDPVRAGCRRLYKDLLALRRSSPTLRDFRAARATLLDDGKRLMVARGGESAPGAPEWRILFNLADEPGPIPPDLAAIGPKFRSEIPLYGAEGEPEPGTLRPREFAIFADPAWEFQAGGGSSFAPR